MCAVQTRSSNGMKRLKTDGIKKPKHPAFALLWLLMIPVQIVLDVVMISLGALADTSMANPEALGHPAPAVTLVSGIAAVIFTIVVFLLSITLTIVRAVILKKRYQKYKAGNQ